MLVINTFFPSLCCSFCDIFYFPQTRMLQEPGTLRKMGACVWRMYNDMESRVTQETQRHDHLMRSVQNYCFCLLGWLDCRRTHRCDVPFCCSVKYTKLDRIKGESNSLGSCSVLAWVELCLHYKLQPRGELQHKHLFLTFSYALWLIFSLCVWPKALQAITLVVFKFNNLHSRRTT